MLRNNIIIYTISYIIIAFLLYLISSSTIPPFALIFLQLSLLISFSYFLWQGLRFTIGAVIGGILLYQLFFTLSLHYYFVDVEQLPFGYNPVDAITYLNITKFSMNHSFQEFLDYMEWKDFELSDYGFPLILRFVYGVLGNVEAGIVVMCIINCFSITLGAWGVYKLALFFLDKGQAKVVALFWGLNSCSIWSNVCGLKESIFTTILIFTMYLMYKYWREKKMYVLLLWIFFLFLTALFRYYLTLFFIILFVCRPLYVSRLDRFIPLFIVLLTFFAAFTSYIISTQIPILTEILLNQTEKVTGLPMILGNMIVGFIGPLPNFLQHDNLEALTYSPFSAFMVFFSIYALLGSWYILKNRVIKLYPLLLFVFFNILLVISSIHSFDYRFSYTMVPFYFILIVYGFIHAPKLGYFKLTRFLYYPLGLILIFWYNLR